MEDKRTEFLKALNEVLKKVGLPSFFETVQRKKVYGDNSFFTVSPLERAVGFEIVYSDEEGFWKSLRVTKQFDGIHDTWGYDSLPAKEAQDPQKLLEKVIELLRTRYQNPRVE